MHDASVTANISLLPQDDGDDFTEAVLPLDAGHRSVAIKTAPGNAHESVDDGPHLWADSWASAPIASGTSLALSVATRSLGLLPNLPHAVPIVIGDALASPTHFASLVIWLHSAVAIFSLNTGCRSITTMAQILGRILMRWPTLPSGASLTLCLCYWNPWVTTRDVPHSVNRDRRCLGIGAHAPQRD
ncbi:hypothetical protein C8R44DRAFT_871618 [Mycena epipterygia]|nr:hypothetical protein C8R44DRAFT_871618 [Mycena epipterygia]